MSSLLFPSRCGLLILACNILMLCQIVLANDGNAAKADAASEQDFEELGLHYGKYLKEVVAALDKDQKFSETIKNMDAEDIKSGKVADQLKHVHEDVRKKLNDLKYLEIQRLRDLAVRKNELETTGEIYHGTDKRKWRSLGASLSNLPEHLGSDSTHFDVKDLHKLMVAATSDLEKFDKERKEDFKTYEMEKEYQFQERLKMLNETEKQEAIKQRQQLKEKHNNHKPVHEPGKVGHFQDVWENEDKLPAKEFDPKTFFALHDTNSDNHWDQYEVRSLLNIEISKIYEKNNPEDDPNEMAEEFENMREHIYKEIDANRDGLISLQEFLDYSKRPEFKQDNGWDDAAKRQVYTKEDYADYEKNRDKFLRQSHGHYDPSFYANQPENMHLPHYGLGMPAGVNPAQYYGYQVDPNHPHAQHIIAQQQQQMAYHQQAAYQQQAAAAGYQQPQVAQHQQYQQVPAVAQQQHYQAVPPVQGNQYQQPQQQAPQVGYQQQQAVPQQQTMQQQQQAVPQQQHQAVPQQQQQAVPQQQQQIPQQPQQATYQQVPQQPSIQQAQAPLQQQVPMQNQVPQAQPQQAQAQQQAPPR